jgi:hypothetical protein
MNVKMDSGLRQNDDRPSFRTALKREVIRNPFSNRNEGKP